MNNPLMVSSGTFTISIANDVTEEGNLIKQYDDSHIFWAGQELEEIWDRKFSHIARETDPSVAMPAPCSKT